MSALIRSTVLIARTQFWRAVRSRRAVICLLIALAPAALPLLVQVFDTSPPASVELFMFPGFFLLLQVVTPVLALILGSTVVTEEIEDRTITYLFTRPLPRASLLFGRWLVVALITSFILAASVLALAASARYGGNPPELSELPLDVVLPLLWMVVAGGLVYSALFAVLGTFLKHPMIVGLAYAFVIEGFLANLPGKSQALTIQFYLRSFLADRGGEAWMDVDPLRATTLDGGGEALIKLLIVLLVTLWIGARTISRRQILLTS